jgi:hypothetical protein
MCGKRIETALALLAAAASLLSVPAPAEAAATIIVVNLDGPGEGFNDPTPAAPVGGNPGVTVGQQRFNTFQHAANLWGATLTSPATILVGAFFNPLPCTATAAVLGSAGPTLVFSDFSGATYANTWFHSALADKLFGSDLAPGFPDIGAIFNSDLGNAGCLTGNGWYYGLDNQHGPLIDLVTVVLHELAHGLGFSNFVDVATGANFLGFTDIYSKYTYDLTTSKFWAQMTDQERMASAINSRNVIWTGANVTAAAPGVLSLGTPVLKVIAPRELSGDYAIGPAAFGPPFYSPGVSGQLIQVQDTGGASLTDACEPLSDASARAVSGRIALIDRGTCTFTIKVKNAQNAGARAALIADTVAGSPPSGLGGTDPTITIPSGRITLILGNTLKDAQRFAFRPGNGVAVNLGVNKAVLAGADPGGRLLLNTPDPVEPGSSISHWDPIAFPNLLMEPAINADLTHSVSPPQDLTFRQLQDVGW